MDNLYYLFWNNLSWKTILKNHFSQHIYSHFYDFLMISQMDTSSDMCSSLSILFCKTVIFNFPDKYLQGLSTTVLQKYNRIEIGYDHKLFPLHEKMLHNLSFVSALNHSFYSHAISTLVLK